MGSSNFQRLRRVRDTHTRPAIPVDRRTDLGSYRIVQHLERSCVTLRVPPAFYQPPSYSASHIPRSSSDPLIARRHIIIVLVESAFACSFPLPCLIPTAVCICQTDRHVCEELSRQWCIRCVGHCVPTRREAIISCAGIQMPCKGPAFKV